MRGVTGLICQAADLARDERQDRFRFPLAATIASAAADPKGDRDPACGCRPLNDGVHQVEPRTAASLGADNRDDKIRLGGC